MTPHDSLKAMHIHGDLHLELFVSEPDVISPVEMAFEETRKIYVAEMLDYPDDPPAGKPERSRIRLLGNTDGDGKIDRCPIFADNVLAMSGYLSWKDGLIVTAHPWPGYRHGPKSIGMFCVNHTASSQSLLFSGQVKIKTSDGRPI